MTPITKFALCLLLVAGISALYIRWRSSYRPKTRHPRVRSKSTSAPFSKVNGAASLLEDVHSLKKASAQWPEILKRLNPDDEPHIRTILLEIRGPHIFAPHVALNIIEDICLSTPKPNGALTRMHLLERVKASMERVTRYGD
jgi:hypothetical protein